METKYKNQLLMQYLKSNNQRSVDLNSQDFIEDFVGWIYSMKKTGKDYLKMLDILEILPLYLERVIELGKGSQDAVLDMRPNSKIITPYAATFKSKIEAEIIEIDAVQLENIGRLIMKDELVISQNPYDEFDLSIMRGLHNKKDNPIVFGVYGKINDKDMLQKRKLIKSVSSKMQEGFIEEAYTNGDNYFHLVATKSKAKQSCR